jgi:perosamine synthetase
MRETGFSRKRRPFRHLPPTAVRVEGSDLRSGLAAMLRPKDAATCFRSLLVERTGSPFCYLVSSGRAALTLILMGLNRLTGRPQVVVPAYGCPTVPQAVLAAGLQPVLCDVSPRTLDLNPTALSRLISPDVLAIVSVHLYGLAQDVEPLLEIGRKHGIFVIEDAAQAFGASFNGRMVGTRGHAGLYSLGRGKCVPTGHGGVIVSQERCATAISEAMRDSVRAETRWDTRALALFLGYGLATHPVGWWYIVRTPLNPAREGMDVQSLPPIRLERLPAVQAGIGASILARLDRVHAIRRENAQRLMAELSDFDFLSWPEIPQGAEPVFLRLPLVVDGEKRASQLFDLLWRQGLGVGRPYRHTLAELFSGALPLNGTDFPGATRLAACLLTLPTHAYLKEEDVGRIVWAFRAVDRNN